VVAGAVVARIYVGAHIPLDLVAGVSLGLMIGVVAHIATRPAPADGAEGLAERASRSLDRRSARSGG
jgi:membrane-associated phospholipid phosphatase